MLFGEFGLFIHEGEDRKREEVGGSGTQRGKASKKPTADLTPFDTFPRLIKEIDDQFRRLFRFFHDNAVAGAGDDFKFAAIRNPLGVGFAVGAGHEVVFLSPDDQRRRRMRMSAEPLARAEIPCYSDWQRGG